jgi:hypothetical protein
MHSHGHASQKNPSVYNRLYVVHSSLKYILAICFTIVFCKFQFFELIKF